MNEPSALPTPRRGLLLLGDPHLTGRPPPFRKDDYARAILAKLAWCLEYAAREALLPVLLGDLFDRPRDNPTWLLGELVELFRDRGVLAVYGNHDCAQPRLEAHDSLSLLVKARAVTLVSAASPWRGTLNGRPVVVGGSSYRQPIPKAWSGGAASEENEDAATDADAPEAAAPRPDVSTASAPPPSDDSLTFWIAHHDLDFPGYEAGRPGGIRPRAGIDVVVNGHLHRRFAPERAGETLYFAPGSLSRRRRPRTGEPVRTPAALRLDVPATGKDVTVEWVEVPHGAAAEVFHAALEDGEEAWAGAAESSFVAGLAELEARRTEGGGGLTAFLEGRYGDFPEEVATAIRDLAREVMEE